MQFWWFQDFSEICIFPWENAYFFCFSAGCRKCIFHISLILFKNQGFHGIMHFWWLQDFSEICIFPWENAYFCLLFGWLQKMHNSIFLERVLSKTPIENAYFLRAIFTAVQKCIMDLAGQLSWSARSPQKPSGGDLLTYVFLIFSMRTMMQRLSESKNCQGTSHKHHKVWIEIMWLKHGFHFLTWCWRATNE